MKDPIGSEFGIVSDEITYGADLETAMRNLYGRIGSDDLPLFVTAVAIQSSTGAITIFVGEVHIRTQDLSGGPPKILKWWYAARCSGPANTMGVTTQGLAPKERGMMEYSVMPGAQPDPIDRTWYNVWYAVCLEDFGKYPRKQED